MITEKKIKKLFVFELLLICFRGFLIDILNFPGIITYIPDVLNLIILFLIYHKTKSIKLKTLTDKFILFFIVWSIITAVLNFVSPILFFWEMRNFCRAFCIFYIFLKLMNEEDCNKIYSFMKILFVINFLITIYQFFILKIDRDYLGGIFGNDTGVNATTNMFLCIICTLSISKYLCKEEKILNVLFIVITTIIIAALAEIKLLFFEVAFIFVGIVALVKPSSKTFFIIIISVIALVLGLNILKNIFPEHYEVIMNPEKLMEYSDMQGGGYGISRINMIQNVNELFFKDSILNKILGFGMGACTMSSRYDFLTSEFYNINFELNYNWFSHAMLYLQTGIVGLILYISIYLSMIGTALKNINKRVDVSNNYFIVVFSVILLINLLYNHWARTEISYLAFIGLALANVKVKKKE